MLAGHRKLPVGCVAALLLAICVQPPLHAQSSVHSPSSTKLVTVPFIGCKSDGQVGPQGAPIGKSKVVVIPAIAAQQLAYYRAEDGFGVLAPRGWYCFGTYGSNGSNLYITPKPVTSAELFSESWKGFSGPAIQASVSIGDTSGRFAVAQEIARIFPAYKAFVNRVIEEKIVPASSFPSGPYPNDKLANRGKNIVEYLTPPNSDGLGTQSWLLKNSNPITGVAILFGQVPSLLQLSMRLPKGERKLGSFIIQQLERDAAHLSQP